MYLPLSWITQTKIHQEPKKGKYTMKHLDTIYSSNIQKSPPNYKNPLQMSKCTPPFWWNAQGQSKSIIKRRWRRWSSKMLQICLQSTNLVKQVHQKLTMSRLNGHDSLQCTTNVKIIQRRWWRSNSSRINRRLIWTDLVFRTTLGLSHLETYHSQKKAQKKWRLFYWL